jgi:hypothetical protein
VMLPREFRRAPAVVVASVPGVIALALLCEAPRIVLRGSDVQVIRMVIVTLKEIAVNLRLDLENVEVRHVSVFVIHTGFI